LRECGKRRKHQDSTGVRIVEHLSETLEPVDSRAQGFEVFCVVRAQRHKDNICGGAGGFSEKPRQYIFCGGARLSYRTPGYASLEALVKGKAELGNQAQERIVHSHAHHGGITNSEDVKGGWSL